MAAATAFGLTVVSAWQHDDDVLIRWILHSQYGGAFSVLVPMGPRTWGPKSEEWVFHMNYPPELEEMFDTDDKVVIEEQRHARRERRASGVRQQGRAVVATQ